MTRRIASTFIRSGTTFLIVGLFLLFIRPDQLPVVAGFFLAGKLSLIMAFYGYLTMEE